MAIRERFTDCDLSDLTALTLPWQMENGQLRPVFSRSAALLSLELSQAAYHLDEECWTQAGWQDILYRGTDQDAAAEGKRGGGFTGQVQSLLHRLRHGVTAVTRNRDERKLDKALLMAHPLPDGRCVIAVGMLGTEKRFSDWAVNLRVANEDGLHSGFAAASRRLEETLDKIAFPETAKRMGLSSLTFSDIVEECRRPGSRFVLWLSGHSLGAAVMQIFALHLIRAGVMPRYIIGYGFASPRVLYEGFRGDISDFPVFHILNRDDLVPKVGAQLHVGRCQLFTPDDRARALWFAGDWADGSFRRLFALTARVHNTRDGIIFLYALLRTVLEASDEETVAAISETLGKYLPDRFTGALGSRINDGLTALLRKLEQVYLSVSGGSPMPKEKAELFYRYLTLEMRLTGSRAFIRRISRIVYAPHRLAAREDGQLAPSYALLVSRRFYALRPCLSGGEAPLWRGKRIRTPAPRGSRRFGLYSAGRRNNARAKKNAPHEEKTI